MDPNRAITRRSALAGAASLFGPSALIGRAVATEPTLRRISRANHPVKGEVIFIHGQ
jgi:hypothetical protein